MADFNPYQAPSAHVEDIHDSETTELADRGTRLGAAIIDTLILIPIAVLMWFLFKPGIFSGEQPSFLSSLLVSFITLGIWIAMNYVLLSRHGQTFGKKLLGIKIVRSDADPCGVGRIAGRRIMIPTLLTQIPFVGMLFALVDVLFIFQESRRTLHDLIADTIVIKA